MSTDVSEKETAANEGFDLSQIEIGMWVVVENEKNNTLRQGFISKINGQNEQTKQIEVQLFEGSLGSVYAIPVPEEITHEGYLFYKHLIKNKSAKSPLHFKTRDFLVENWTTFRSQPRETIFEKAVFLTTENDPRYLVLDAEYHWEDIEINEELFERLNSMGVSCINIDSKYKISMESLELIFNHFQQF